MNKKFDYEEITRRFAKGSPDYAAIASNRALRCCKRYVLTDNVYFEYWGPNEWEFTIGTPDKMECLRLAQIVSPLAEWLHTKKVTASRLPNLMTVCKSVLMKAA